ncbi:MAG: bifunctional UDP-sugar hydrolase/5'-nucleotidase [Elusimicrobiaceae bacterium]|nr:bifunctional UDP-sugar hydrolase/5'-nucleotidase [Elusimicrobiaceae bacterium]
MNLTVIRTIVAMFRRAAGGLRAGAWLFVAAAMVPLLPAGCSNNAEIVIYHTADVHGAYWPRTLPGGDRQGGGYAVLKSLLDAEKAPYLLLGGGDWFMGTPEGQFSHKTSAVWLMNDVGYTAACPGGMDFAEGWSDLAEMLKQARFQALGANVYSAKTGRRVEFLSPYMIRDYAGLKIGIFGLVGTDVYKTVPARSLGGLRITDPIEEAARVVPELRKKGCKLVIAVTHIGLNSYGQSENADDAALAARVPGISVILGGNSHIETEHPVKIGETYIVHSGAMLAKVGRLSLGINSYTGRITRFRYRLIPLESDRYGEDEKIKARLAEIRAGVDKLLDRAIGRSREELTHSGGGETPLGDWMTDCFSRWLKTDAALLNYSALRNAMPAGRVTERVLYDIYPYNDQMMLIKLRGEDLRAVLEAGLSSPDGRLQISGITVYYNPAGLAGGKITRVLVGGKPLDDCKTYHLAATDNMMAGGSGYGGLGRAVEFSNTRELARERAAWCFYTRQLATAPEGGRWIEQQPQTEPD